MTYAVLELEKGFVNGWFSELKMAEIALLYAKKKFKDHRFVIIELKESKVNDTNISIGECFMPDNLD